MPECRLCGREDACLNDVLFHVIRDHDADMRGFPFNE